MRHIRFANEEFASLVGYSIDGSEALSNSAVLSPRDRQAERTELFARVFTGESNRSANQYREQRAGSSVEISVVPVRPVTIDDKVVGAVIECVPRELYHDKNHPAASLAGREAPSAN
jgi:PAS domain-containing protein